MNRGRSAKSPAGSAAKKPKIAPAGFTAERIAFVTRLQTLVDIAGSMRTLAAIASLSGNAVRSYLHGSEPTRPVILALASATGVSPDWLLSGSGPMCPAGSPLPEKARRAVDDAARSGSSPEPWAQLVLSSAGQTRLSVEAAPQPARPATVLEPRLRGRLALEVAKSATGFARATTLTAAGRELLHVAIGEAIASLEAGVAREGRIPSTAQINAAIQHHLYLLDTVLAREAVEAIAT